MGAISRGPDGPAWSQTLACADAPCTGTGRSHDRPFGNCRRSHREGEEPQPMMHGREKSDSAIVAGKPTNNAVPTAAEPVERRAEAKGNASQQSTDRAQNRAAASQVLARIRKVAKERKKERFTALLHHISVDLLDEAFFDLKEDAAAGVDGLSWADYEQNLERNLEDLHARIHRGAYRALPSRRVYIAKPDGRQRPLAIAA